MSGFNSKRGSGNVLGPGGGVVKVRNHLRKVNDDSPKIDITLNNVVCNFNLGCKLKLNHIAKKMANVELHPRMGMLVMKLRKPVCSATIWASGKVIMTGARTEVDSKVGARRCARTIQKLGYDVKFMDFRIVNILASSAMPFPVRIMDFAQAYPLLASYEPELHPGVTYWMREIKASLKVFSTGSITITAPSVRNIQLAVQKVYAQLFEFKIDRSWEDLTMAQRKKQRREKMLLREHHKRLNKPVAELAYYDADTDSSLDLD